jgi:hypothetical protein
MQSIEYRKFSPQRIGLAIAAVGTLVIALTGAGMIFDGSDDGGSSARPVVHSVQRAVPADSAAFIEMNTNLPAISDERTIDAQDGEPLELNMMPPGSVRPNAISLDTTRFLELNTVLPGRTTPSVVSSETTRFLEMNELPAGDGQYLPTADESHPVGPLTEY